MTNYHNFIIDKSIFARKKDAILVRELFYGLRLIPGNKDYDLKRYFPILRGGKCAIRGALDALKLHKETRLIVQFKDQTAIQKLILLEYGILHSGKIAIKNNKGRYMKTYLQTKKAAKKLIPYLEWHTK